MQPLSVLGDAGNTENNSLQLELSVMRTTGLMIFSSDFALEEVYLIGKIGPTTVNYEIVGFRL